MDQKQITNTFIVALTLWREGSGESHETRVVIANVITNRVARPGWWGRDWVGVCTAPAQFTSMHPPKGQFDPNLVRWPSVTDVTFGDCLAIADAAVCGKLDDTTESSLYYYDESMDKNPPAWAAKLTHVRDVGRLRLFK